MISRQLFVEVIVLFLKQMLIEMLSQNVPVVIQGSVWNSFSYCSNKLWFEHTDVVPIHRANET